MLSVACMDGVGGERRLDHFRTPLRLAQSLDNGPMVQGFVQFSTETLAQTKYKIFSLFLDTFTDFQCA